MPRCTSTVLPGRHVAASDEGDGSRQVARLLLRALAGGAAVRADEVRVGDALDQNRREQAQAADERENRPLYWKIDRFID